MNKKINCVPIYIKENISCAKEQENNMISFISKKHPELQKLEINRVSQQILELSNGINTIEDIIQVIFSQYSNVTIEKVEEDIFNILLRFWRLGIIEWEDENPYFNMYNKEINGVVCKILNEEEAIEQLRESSDYNFTPMLSKNFLQQKINISQRVYYGFEQYNIIKKDNIEIFYGLSYKNAKSKSCYINFYNISNVYATDEIIKLIQWSIKKYEKFIKVRLLRVDTMIVKELYTEGEHDKVLYMLEKMSFKNTGTMLNHIFVEDKYYDINIYSLNL